MVRKEDSCVGLFCEFDRSKGEDAAALSGVLDGPDGYVIAVLLGRS